MKLIKLLNMIFVFLFLVIIAFPTVDTIWKADPFKHLNENRELAKFPDLRLDLNVLKGFPKDFEKYYNDHFGFRNSLIRLNFLVKYKLLNVSPSSQVLVGKNGWLFYSAERETEDYRGITHFEESDLKNWAKSLELKRIWLEQQGIKFLYVVIPNKSTIYSERMPDSLNKLRVKTGLDEFIEYINNHTGVEVVDLRYPLLKAKNNYQIYLKTDTHWNYYGAFLAYQEIIKPISRWFPAVKTLNITDFTINKYSKHGGDLAGIIGGTEFINDDEFKFEPIKPYKAHMIAYNIKPKDPFAMSQDAPQLPRAVIFRDSFFTHLVPFVSENMQYAIYFSEYWNSQTPIVDIVHKYHPNIVIEEIVERHIRTGVADFTTNVPSFDNSSREIFTKKLPSNVRKIAIIDGGMANAEVINNKLFANGITVNKKEMFALEGWAIDTTSKTVPGTIFVKLESTNTDKSFYAAAKRIDKKRLDVAQAFNNPVYEAAAYVLTADINSIPSGQYYIKLIQQVNGIYYSASTHKQIDIK